MCHYYTKYYFCSEGAYCTAGFGWINRQNQRYLRSYEEKRAELPCPYAERGCNRMDYLGFDKYISENLCPTCMMDNWI